MESQTWLDQKDRAPHGRLLDVNHDEECQIDQNAEAVVLELLQYFGPHPSQGQFLAGSHRFHIDVIHDFVYVRRCGPNHDDCSNKKNCPALESRP